MKKILSNIFNFAVTKRNNSFDMGKKKIHKCVSPVISVGNLSVGGSGKTPFVKYLACFLKESKFNPAIVGRGYKRKSKGTVVISNGKEILVKAEVGGDEMLLLAESCNVPVLAHDMKFQGALIAESMFDVDCIIIDDGYQHRQLFRDIDILLIDQETLSNPHLIPKGRLREPVSSISRADVVCFMGDFDYSKYDIENFLNDKYIMQIKAYPGKPYFMANKQQVKSIQKLACLTFSGIAKPENFKTMVQALNYNVIKNIAFGDHHFYKIQDIKFLIEKCKKHDLKYLATTEKDLVKIREFGNVFAENSIEVIVFPISVKVLNGEEEFINLLRKVLKKGNGQ